MSELDFMEFQGYVESHSFPASETVDIIKSATWLILDNSVQIVPFDRFRCAVADAQKDEARYGEVSGEADYSYGIHLYYGESQVLSVLNYSRRIMSVTTEDEVIRGENAMKFGLHIIRQLQRLQEAGKIKHLTD
jgi:hypothetical protein